MALKEKTSAEAGHLSVTAKPQINFEQVKAKGVRQESLASEPEITVIPIRQPRGDEFFRTDPRETMTMALNILTLKDEQEEYLIYEDVLDAIGFETMVKKKTAFVLYTMTNIPFIATIPLPDEQGKLNQWHKSALLTIEKAKTHWIRRQADKLNSQYTTQQAKPGICPELKLTDLTMEEVIEQAFRDFIIDRIDHPVLTRLGH